MVAVQLEWREFPFCVGPGFLPYKNRLWSARNFGLWSRSTSLPCTYSMMPIITVIIECPVCLIAVHCSYSFPWHMMVAVSFQEEIERRYRELRLDWLYYVYRWQGYDLSLYLFRHTTYNSYSTSRRPLPSNIPL